MIETTLMSKVISSQECEKLIKLIAANSIETRPFYPDLNLAPYFENTVRFPNSEVFGNDRFFLPAGPNQYIENIDR